MLNSSTFNHFQGPGVPRFYLTNATASFLLLRALLVDLTLKHAVKDALYERRNGRQRLRLLLFLNSLGTADLPPSCCPPSRPLNKVK